MSWKLVAIFTYALYAVACGNSDLSAAGRTGTNKNERTALKAPRQTRSLVRKETRVTAFVSGAQRLSIIDPATAREVSGQTVSGAFDLALPIAQLDGVALVGPTRLRVLSGGATRDFGIDGGTGAWDAASGHATFVALTATGLRVARHLRGAVWQDVTLPASFAADAFPMVSADGRTVAVVPSRGGTVELYFALFDGEPLAPALSCALPAQATPYVAAFFDDQTKTIWLGDLVGNVVTIPASDCAAPTLLTTLAHGVARITRLDAARIAVTQEKGAIATYTSEWRTIETGCDFPLTPSAFAGTNLAFVCLKEVVSTETELSYQSASLRTLGTDTPIDLARTSAIAIVAEQDQALILGDDAFGTLTSVSLSTGAATTKTGLFLSGILGEL